MVMEMVWEGGGGVSVVEVRSEAERDDDTEARRLVISSGMERFHATTTLPSLCLHCRVCVSLTFSLMAPMDLDG